MTSLAIAAGLFGGMATILGMWRLGLLAERSGLVVLVAAIAFFYPVFAVMEGAGFAITGLHALVFIAFATFACYGFRAGTNILAFGLIAHGLFDITTLLTGHPGPAWWPVFCGSLDITAGLCILALLHRHEIPQ